MTRYRRTQPLRLSRRRFLGGAGALAAAAALGACDTGTPGESSLEASATRAGTSPTLGADQTATPIPTSSQPRRGGTVRFTGLVSGDGVYDPHKTRNPNFYGLQAAAYSRLIAYERQDTGALQTDLATNLPEQPDGLTYIFTLSPLARWHDADPLDGRRVTSDDVRFSIERQRDGDGTFARKAHWVNVSEIETPNDETIIVRTAGPVAPMMHYFADVNAFIVPPELATAGDSFGPNRQAGSGPFTWVEWDEGTFCSLGRHTDWYGGDGLPYLDGITLRQPVNEADIEALLRTRQLDVAFLSRTLADRLKASIPDLVEATIGETRFWGMRFQQVNPPWNDPRFRSALTIAIDRRDMLRRFFAGSGEMNPWVSWPVTRWALPQFELQARPGYRTGTTGRLSDVAEARALLDAVIADEIAIPETLELSVFEEAEARVPLGQLIASQLNSSLGLNVTVSRVETNQLVEELFRGERPWIAGPDTGWIDLDDWMYPYFHSTGNSNTFALRNTELDGLIESQRVELDEERRRRLGIDLQRRLLDLNLGVNFISERIIAIGWPYVRDFPLDISEGYEHRLARTWIDTADPRYTPHR